jgi:hypothetical protein
MIIRIKSKREFGLEELFGEDAQKETEKLVNKFLKAYIKHTNRKLDEYSEINSQLPMFTKCECNDCVCDE